MSRPLEAHRARPAAATGRRSPSGSVDLPAPLAPMMATVSPSSSAKVDAEQRLEVAVEGGEAAGLEQAPISVTLDPQIDLAHLGRRHDRVAARRSPIIRAEIRAPPAADTTEVSACSTCSIQTMVMPRGVDGADESRRARRIRPRSARRRSRRAGGAAGRVGQRAGQFEPLAVEQGERAGTAIGQGDAGRCARRMSAQASATSASRCRGRRTAATSRFSNTVRFSKGCGIWNERPMPARQRAHRRRLRDVAAVEADAAAIRLEMSPVIRLNSVDLPAPFGPMMPSASPGLHVEGSRRPSTLRAPKLFDTRSSSRIGTSRLPGEGARRRRRPGPSRIRRSGLPSCRRSGSPARSCCRR